MGLPERAWDTLRGVLGMNERVLSLTQAIKEQQIKIENLTERVIRLEAMLELGMLRQPSQEINTVRRLDGQSKPSNPPPPTE